MTPSQAAAVDAMLQALRQAGEGRQAFNHGDNSGADCEAGFAAFMLGYYVVIHPPTDSSKRGRGAHYHEACPVAHYLDRNRNVVSASMVVIATPGEPLERLRSGTWNTVRYARHYRTPLLIVRPDGATTLELFQRGDD